MIVRCQTPRCETLFEVGGGHPPIHDIRCTVCGGAVRRTFYGANELRRLKSRHRILKLFYSHTGKLLQAEAGTHGTASRLTPATVPLVEATLSRGAPRVTFHECSYPDCRSMVSGTERCTLHTGLPLPTAAPASEEEMAKERDPYRVKGRTARSAAERKRDADAKRSASARANWIREGYVLTPADLPERLALLVSVAKDSGYSSRSLAEWLGIGESELSKRIHRNDSYALPGAMMYGKALERIELVEREISPAWLVANLRAPRRKPSLPKPALPEPKPAAPPAAPVASGATIAPEADPGILPAAPARPARTATSAAIEAMLDLLDGKALLALQAAVMERLAKQVTLRRRRGQGRRRRTR